ncbi:hypothetical protein RO3G_16011 [Lichtheimia corymbifera JMRC:FSU:9682]|uniref:Phosphoglycerate mutase n=1 Tax=Lichtheimia corymbifera JMRC:FSU:9682 TaxID=1263082 RepID=A0A068SGF5_9FUNG|nr:hypothetical protein RO3G_16011 [Lichtheimia corymbifera JMRC:FSU:9682]
MTATITFVRHGNTDANVERWLQGQTDTVLNAKGLEQAELVGDRLSNEGFDIIYCSDLERCKQTLKPISRHYPTTPIVYRPVLRERGFGSLSGKPLAFLNNESMRQRVSVDKLVKQSGGESENEFETRVIQAYHDIAKGTATGQRVLVVTHGGPLHILTQYWIEHAGFSVHPSIYGTQGYRHGNTAVTRLKINSGQPHCGIIELLNSTCHLAEHQQSGRSVAV